MRDLRRVGIKLRQVLLPSTSTVELRDCKGAGCLRFPRAASSLTKTLQGISGVRSSCA